MIDTRVIQVTVSLDIDKAESRGLNDIDAITNYLARHLNEVKENFIYELEQAPRGLAYLDCDLGVGVSWSRPATI